MEYIVNYEPFIPDNIDLERLASIETKIKNNEAITSEEAKIFLDNLIYLVRYKINPELSDYTFKCDLAQSMLYHYLKDLGCKVTPNNTQNSITNNIEGHNFLIVEFNIQGVNSIFLLDPTYIQFFKKEECMKENYMVINNAIVKTPKPGYFISKQHQHFANCLLQYGNIALTEEVAMMYGDSFYNTKVGEYYLPINNMYTFKSIPGSIYITSFNKGSGLISKTKDDLQEMGLLIESVVELEELKQPKL